MTTYGTIPTSSSSSTRAGNLEYISRAKEHIKAGLATCRPWREMFDFRCFSIPESYSDATARIKLNTAYFRMNYRLVFYAILFLFLLPNPISLVVLAAMMAVWLLVYTLCEKPLVFFGRTIPDSVARAALAVATIAGLTLAHAAANFVGALLTGFAVVWIHGAMWTTDDEEDAEVC